MFQTLSIFRRFKSIIVAAVAYFGTFICTANATEVQVVTSIKPLHSLTSSVMNGVADPHLLMRGVSSPHTFMLRPSDAEELSKADVIFMIDESLETSLDIFLGSLTGDARIVKIMDAPGITKKSFRDAGLAEVSAGDRGHDDHDDNGHDEHEAEEHDGHGHDEHDEHEQDEHHDKHEEHEGEAHHDDEHHEHEEHEGKDHDDHEGEAHGDEHDHDHGDFDPHIWLDPENARAMVREIAKVLAEVDVANAEKYMANAYALDGKLHELTDEITHELETLHGKQYIVFHDAYRYFEDRFGLTTAGSLVVNPDRKPGAKRLREIRDRMRDANIVCVFDEPQFNNDIIKVIVEDTDARTGTIDPLGATVEDGPELYFNLIRNMASTFKNCLTGV